MTDSQATVEFAAGPDASASGLEGATSPGVVPSRAAVADTPSEENAAEGMEEGDSPPTLHQIAVVRQKSRKVIGEPQVIFARDISIGAKDGLIGDVRVENTRSRVRINRLKNGRASGRHLIPDKKLEEEKLQLTLRMMHGVRLAVGRQAGTLVSENLEDDEFSQEDRYVIPRTQTPSESPDEPATSSSKLKRRFKFRDYAPKAFRNLRRIFGIDEEAYMSSVAGDYEYLELITNSKSGSFFFYSHDQRYIIKNMKRAEAKFFRGILKQYYEHHRDHPDSMLIRFCGMYLVRKGRRKIPFVVMKCIDGPAQMKLHRKYDLKGSTVNRTAKEGEKVLKDNNLRNAEGKFYLGSQRDAILKVIRADAEFLRDVNVMDYSMFMSVHDGARPPERILRRGEAEFFTFADEASNRTVPKFQRLPSARVRREDLAALMEAEKNGSDAATSEADVSALSTAGSAEGATSTPGGIRFRPDGGIDAEGGDSKEIYWMGVIDVLQVYTHMKHAETWYKGIGKNKSELSCVAPPLYCERFVEFMAERTC